MCHTLLWPPRPCFAPLSFSPHCPLQVPSIYLWPPGFVFRCQLDISTSMTCWHLVSSRYQSDRSYPRLKTYDSLTLLSPHLPDPQRNQVWSKFCTLVALKSIHCVSSVPLLGYHHLLFKVLRQHPSAWGRTQSILLPALRVVLLKSILVMSVLHLNSYLFLSYSVPKPLGASAEYVFSPWA